MKAIRHYSKDVDGMFIAILRTVQGNIVLVLDSRETLSGNATVVMNKNQLEFLYGHIEDMLSDLMDEECEEERKKKEEK